MLTVVFIQLVTGLPVSKNLAPFGKISLLISFLYKSFHIGIQILIAPAAQTDHHHIILPEFHLFHGCKCMRAF